MNYSINSNASNKMKVAIYAPTFFPKKVGGSERQAKLLASFLIKNNINVILLTPHEKNLLEHENFEGIEIYRFKTPLSFFKKENKSKIETQSATICFDYSSKTGTDLYYPKFDFNIKSLIYSIDLFLGMLYSFFKIRNEINLIQINTVTYQAFLLSIVSKILDKKFVVKDSTMDGVDRMYGCLFPNFSRKILIKNAHFVAMTTAIKNNMISAGVSDNKIFLIPNGIIINKEAPKNKINNKKCLFVGNLSQQPAKGVDILLKSWGNVIDKYPNAKLTIIGDGDINQYKNYLKKFTYSDSISFLGHQNPINFYKSHEIFILPSRREGLSNALLEAINFGLKIVATDISGNQDLIINKNYGILVKPNNIEALSAGIIDILESNSLEIYNLTFDHLKENYSIEIVTRKYISMYNKLIF